VGENPAAGSVVALSLVAAPRAVSEARAVLGRVLDERGVSGDARADALLVTSELVANAVTHGSRSGDEIEVELALGRRRIQICVRDPLRGRSTPVALTADERRQEGRGLQIVSHLSEWSERVIGGWREVRAELTW
jgi:anti-sigma regulatory factor (Ser/Thr protein kinase)